MAIRNIREYGDEVLTKTCKEVKEMTPRTKELIEICWRLCTMQMA